MVKRKIGPFLGEIERGIKMRKVGKVIFKVVRFLYFKKLCPWFIWSPVYDHLHRL